MPLIAAEIEGTIEQIGPQGTGAVLKVAGVTVVVDVNIVGRRAIRTPTKKNLDINDLLAQDKFPGRDQAGFLGASVIARGNYRTETKILEVKVQANPAPGGPLPFEEFPSIEIEPGENVLLGPLTSLFSPNLVVNDVPVALISNADKRMPGKPVKNEFGFEIVPQSIAQFSTAACEGYYSAVDSTFHAHTITVDGEAKLVDPVHDQISITRAQARNRGAEYDIELRGGFTQKHITAGTISQNIVISRVDNGVTTPLGNATKVVILQGPFGRWRYNASITAGLPPLDKAPTHVVVENSSAPEKPTAKEEDVEIFKQ